MQTYEYRCKSCGYYFEKFQSIKDDPVKECPKCGEPVRKLFSTGAGLIFKGSGFYITDYKRKPPSQDTQPSKADSKSGGAAGEKPPKDSTPGKTSDKESRKKAK